MMLLAVIFLLTTLLSFLPTLPQSCTITIQFYTSSTSCQSPNPSKTTQLILPRSPYTDGSPEQCANCFQCTISVPHNPSSDTSQALHAYSWSWTFSLTSTDIIVRFWSKTECTVNTDTSQGSAGSTELTFEQGSSDNGICVNISNTPVVLQDGGDSYQSYEVGFFLSIAQRDSWARATPF